MEKSKSRSLKLAANLIFVIGLCVCMLGAIVYLILHELDVDMPFIGTFQWEHLYYVAALLGVFVVIAVIFRIAGIAAASKEMRLAAETEINEIPDAVDDSVDQSETETETDVPDQEDTDKNDCVAAAAIPAKFCVSDLLKGKPIPDETKEKIVATVKKNAPVIAAVAATLTVSVIVGKLAKEKRKAKIRKNILDLLY